MADVVVESAGRSRAPHIDVPSRSLGNVKYNKAKRFIEMGSGTNRRELFNLAQAKSYMWVQMTKASGAEGTGPPIRLFAYSPSRSTKTAKELYAGMRGGSVLMTDGYDPYDAVAEHYQLVHLGCWAHCRRYVNDALQALPKGKRGPEQLAVRLMDEHLQHVEASLAFDRPLPANELSLALS